MSVAQDETIGGDDAAYTAAEPATTKRKEVDKGFGRGSIVANVGFMYASSLIGGEFEFGVAKNLGVQVGAGLFGGNAGIRVHPYSRKHIDMFISGTANYMPALQAVLPAVNFNLHGYFGNSARVGVGGMIGIMMCTVDKTLTNGSTSLRYRPGQLMLSYALGVPIKIKRAT
jgi:hypothetical protein